MIDIGSISESRSCGEGLIVEMWKKEIFSSIGENAQLLLAHWQSHKGSINTLSMAQDTSGRLTNLLKFMLILKVDDESNTILSFVGQEVENRETMDDALGSHLLDLYMPADRAKLVEIITELKDKKMGMCGTVERNLGDGRPLLQRSFLMLPIVNKEGNVDKFINVDDDPDVRRHLIDVYSENAGLDVEFTRLVEYELIDLSL